MNVASENGMAVQRTDGLPSRIAMVVLIQKKPPTAETEIQIACQNKPRSRKDAPVMIPTMRNTAPVTHKIADPTRRAFGTSGRGHRMCAMMILRRRGSATKIQNAAMTQGISLSIRSVIQFLPEHNVGVHGCELASVPCDAVRLPHVPCAAYRLPIVLVVVLVLDSPAAAIRGRGRGPFASLTEDENDSVPSSLLLAELLYLRHTCR